MRSHRALLIKDQQISGLLSGHCDHCKGISVINCCVAPNLTSVIGLAALKSCLCTYTVATQHHQLAIAEHPIQNSPPLA